MLSVLIIIFFCCVALWTTMGDIILFLLCRIPWSIVGEKPSLIIWQLQSTPALAVFAFSEVGKWGLCAVKRWQSWISYALVCVGIVPMSVVLKYTSNIVSGHYQGAFDITRMLLVIAVILAGKIIIWRYCMQLMLKVTHYATNKFRILH